MICPCLFFNLKIIICCFITTKNLVRNVLRNGDRVRQTPFLKRIRNNVFCDEVKNSYLQIKKLAWTTSSSTSLTFPHQYVKNLYFDSQLTYRSVVCNSQKHPKLRFLCVIFNFFSPLFLHKLPRPNTFSTIFCLEKYNFSIGNNLR